MCPAKRLEYLDYSSAGRYFVTICTNFKRCTLGKVKKDRVELSQLGWTAHDSWIGIERHFPGTSLHSFVVMPNHVHGLIEIKDGRAQHAAPLQGKSATPSSLRPASLSAIVRSFKSEVTRRARLELNCRNDIWQRNYYDRVIRDDREFASASRYIAENPLRWQAKGELGAETKEIQKQRRAQHAAPLQRKRMG